MRLKTNESGQRRRRIIIAIVAKIASKSSVEIDLSILETAPGKLRMNGNHAIIRKSWYTIDDRTIQRFGITINSATINGGTINNSGIACACECISPIPLMKTQAIPIASIVATILNAIARALMGRAGVGEIAFIFYQIEPSQKYSRKLTNQGRRMKAIDFSRTAPDYSAYQFYGHQKSR
jgi:hypothetical protein